MTRLERDMIFVAGHLEGATNKIKSAFRTIQDELTQKPDPEDMPQKAWAELITYWLREDRDVRVLIENHWKRVARLNGHTVHTTYGPWSVTLIKGVKVEEKDA